MSKSRPRSLFGRRAIDQDREPDPIGIVIIALFPIVTVALIGLLQDATIAFIVAIIGAVTAVAMPPSRAR